MRAIICVLDSLGIGAAGDAGRFGDEGANTLGHIADPLLSTVTGYAELDLAALVFHELAHQVAYLPGDSSFNEAFATAVEEAGVARYAARHADAATLATWRKRRGARAGFVALFVAARADLERLYRTRVAPEAMRRVARMRRVDAGLGPMHTSRRSAAGQVAAIPWSRR